MNQTIVLQPRFYAVQEVRAALSHVSHWHRVRAVRDAAEKARADIFDVDIAEAESVIQQIGDNPESRRLRDTLAELKEFA